MDHYSLFKEVEIWISAHGAWSDWGFKQRKISNLGWEIWRLPVLPGFSRNFLFIIPFINPKKLIINVKNLVTLVAMAVSNRKFIANIRHLASRG
jgi:hypothetical protein